MNEIADALATLSMGLKTLAEGMNVISRQVNQLTEDQVKLPVRNTPKKAAQKSSAKVHTPAKTQQKKSVKRAVKSEAPNGNAVKTASDTVFELIKHSGNGINYAHIVEVTGYNKKKIANIFFNLKKQGKIKSVSKGVYTLA
jgi:regulator of replication initiation timing